jgi:hypothetical protein
MPTAIKSRQLVALDAVGALIFARQPFLEMEKL